VGLKDTIKQAVKTGMKAVGDVRVFITYTSVTLGSYDPETDTTAETVVNYTNVPAVNAKLVEREVEWFPADVITQKLLIAALDLPVVPKADDTVTIDGSVWQVKRVNRVPGDSLWVVFVQEP